MSLPLKMPAPAVSMIGTTRINICPKQTPVISLTKLSQLAILTRPFSTAK